MMATRFRHLLLPNFFLYLNNTQSSEFSHSILRSLFCSLSLRRSSAVAPIFAMPMFPLRVFLLHNLLRSLLLSLVPKKIRQFLPSSWFPTPQKLLADEKATPSPSHPPSSSPPLSSLKRVFQMFDRNGDGRITKKELNASLENLGIFIPGDELRQMIEKIDVNGDGCVDIDEFGALYESIMAEREGEAEVREAFEVFDENGDGFISVEELRSVMAALGLKQGRSAEECEKMIKKVDDNGDGMVDFAEFKKMMKLLP